jgi:hypothetical protein
MDPLYSFEQTSSKYTLGVGMWTCLNVDSFDSSGDHLNWPRLEQQESDWNEQ